MTRPDDLARQVQHFDSPARPGRLARLLAWLTRRQCENCRIAPWVTVRDGYCLKCWR